MRISDWSSDVCSSDLDVFGIENAVAVIEMVHLSVFSDQPSIVIPAQAGTHERHAGPVFAVRVHGSRIKSGMTKEGALSPAGARSEEQTSELQALMRISYNGFCLKIKTTIDRASIRTHITY